MLHSGPKQHLMAFYTSLLANAFKYKLGGNDSYRSFWEMLSSFVKPVHNTYNFFRSLSTLLY